MVFPLMLQSAEVSRAALTPDPLSEQPTVDPLNRNLRLSRASVRGTSPSSGQFFAAASSSSSFVSPLSSVNSITAPTSLNSSISSSRAAFELPIQAWPILDAPGSQTQKKTRSSESSFTRAKKYSGKSLTQEQKVKAAFKAREEESRKRQRLVYRQEKFTNSKEKVIKNRQGKIEGFRFKDGGKILYRSVSAKWIEIRNAQGGLEHSIASDVVPSQNTDAGTSLALGKELKAFYQNARSMEFHSKNGVRWILMASRQENAPPVHQLIYPEGHRYFLYRGFMLRHIDPQGKVTDFTPGGNKVRSF